MIPNKVGPTRCRATCRYTNLAAVSRRDPHPGLDDEKGIIGEEEEAAAAAEEE